VAVQRLPLLGSREDELHRAARLPRQRRCDRLRPEEGLGPERAAHRRNDDPDAVGGDPEDARQLLAQVERRLCAGEDLEPVAFPACDARVRLHRGVLRRGRAVRLLDDDVCGRPGGGDVPVVKLEAVAYVRSRQRSHPEVRGAARGESDLVVHERRARSGRFDHVEDGRQLAVVDQDESGRLLRVACSLGGDGRDDIADVAHPVEREHGLVLDLHAVARESTDVVREQRDASGRDGAWVDAEHLRMCVRRADEPGVELAVEVDVLGVARAAGDTDIGHPTSSRARRTSTSITRRR
jgi:hypothetical protein